MPSDTSKESVDITERDIVFDCPHCNGELVVDRDGAGMIFDCSHCSKSVTVPQYNQVHRAVAIKGDETAAESQHSPSPATPVPVVAAPPAAATTPPTAEGAKVKVYNFDGTPPEQVAKRLDELRLHYKENSSQRTEMRGHINRAQIELHRYQLKLQKLVERQADMESEIRAAQAFLGEVAK